MSASAPKPRKLKSPRSGAGVSLRVHELPSDLLKKKILLLEDDLTFKEIMTDFLRENNCEVVAVQNGAEGVHEVLTQEFDVILCDMLMPPLPGDMFYRAVERMRPHLCDRFIFMTGYRGNVQVNEFIKHVRGTVLTKPFHADDLLELIAFVELRTMLLAA